MSGDRFGRVRRCAEAGVWIHALLALGELDRGQAHVALKLLRERWTAAGSPRAAQFTCGQARELIWLLEVPELKDLHLGRLAHHMTGVAVGLREQVTVQGNLTVRRYRPELVWLAYAPPNKLRPPSSRYGDRFAAEARALELARRWGLPEWPVVTRVEGRR